MSRMLGPALLSPLQAKALADGAEMTVLAASLYPAAWNRAEVGDFLWVREPYVEVKGHVEFCDVHEFVIGHGPLEWRKNLPDWLRPYIHELRFIQHQGKGLHKGMSRAILEITAIGSKSLRCRVRMQTVVEFLGAKAA